MYKYLKKCINGLYIVIRSANFCSPRSYPGEEARDPGWDGTGAEGVRKQNENYPVGPGQYREEGTVVQVVRLVLINI